ncbi:MAG TPA: hypothetical protein VF588_22470 [Pyrinomonadaceae bacterium]|jgi:hypothetical protein
MNLQRLKAAVTLFTLIAVPPAPRLLRDGLRDPRATPEKLRELIPNGLPSGRPVQRFQ